MTDGADDSLLFVQLLSDAVIGVTPHFKSQKSSFLIVHVSAAYNRTENTYVCQKIQLDFYSNVLILPNSSEARIDYCGQLNSSYYV